MDYSPGFLQVGFKLGVFVISFLGLWPGNLSSGFAEKEWNLRKTAHFFIYYRHCPEDFLNRVEEVSEKSYYSIGDEMGFYRDEFWVWENRAKIYIFDNRKDYLSYTKMGAWSGGCAFPRRKTICTYAGSRRFLGALFTHELTHLIFREFIKHHSVPLWLDEGVAVFMEKSNRAIYLRQAESIINSGKFIPLEKLFSLNINDLDRNYKPPSERTDVVKDYDFVHKFYLESFSLVNFLISSYGNYKFLDFCRDLRGGKSFQRSFFSEYSYFKNLADLQKRWVEFYQQG